MSKRPSFRPYAFRGKPNRHGMKALKMLVRRFAGKAAKTLARPATFEARLAMKWMEAQNEQA